MQQPYFNEPAGQLYHGDCVQLMHELPEAMYDLLVTSPPYNIGKDYELLQPFGDYLKLLADFIKEGYRLLKPGGYCIINYADYYIFAGPETRVQPMEYLYHLLAERAGFRHMCTRVWQKDFASMSDPYTIASTLPKLEAEHLSTFRKPGKENEKEIVREQDLHPRAVWSTAGIKQSTSTLKNHKAAYPEVLMTYVFKVYADPGNTVVEPFCGSGTTPYVAKKMGIKYVAFEKDASSCELSKRRLTQMVFDWDESLGQEVISEIRKPITIDDF
jgi:adenine-specific DNA-methyltransferase